MTKTKVAPFYLGHGVYWYRAARAYRNESTFVANRRYRQGRLSP